MRRSLDETAEAWTFRLRHGRLPLAGLEDVVPILDLLENSGGSALAEDFRPLIAAARAAESVRRALRHADSPLLSSRRDGPAIARRPHSNGRADSSPPTGPCEDDASEELARLRGRLRRRRTEISGRMERMLEQKRDALGDALLVLRNDRYCLPVLASARGRVPGIVHDRSGSGQTVFVEPLEVIEANNDLAMLAAEERRETARLLTEFGRFLLSRAEELERAAEGLGELDALEAKVELGEQSEGRLPEISEDGHWTLRAARHPLLDPRLAPIRRRVLGETREERPAIPLDLDLHAGQKLLVVSGPNAGGKTVVLKTAGLFSLLAQSGIPVGAGPGTRLPVFGSIRAEIGDAQAILSDRSTFSSSVETLASILEAADGGTLALVDEVGGATDPEEGSALAIAWIEEYLARGGRAIVSTHLSAVKAFAAGRPDAVCAAMEFDEGTGSPTYRLHPGLSGRSHALSVARERGIPESVLERARDLLGDAWQRRDRAESEAEAALERLRRSEEDLAGQRDRARAEAERLRSAHEEARRETRRLLEEGLEGFDRARRELSRRLEEELERIRRDPSRRAQASADELLAEAEAEATSEPVLRAAREQALEKSRDVAVGQPARIRGLNVAGTLLSVEGDAAWLDVAGKRMRVERANIEAAEGPPPAPRSRSVPDSRVEEPAGGGPVPEVNVIGSRLDDAIPAVEKALDDALLAGEAMLRVIHGHGTGRLRDGLRDHLRSHPAVASLRAAPPREGGNGATILELRS